MPSPINPAHIDVQSLRLFLRVVRMGSLTKAAEEVGLTTSALSKRLSELEQLMGTPLLIRHRRGITLTPAGSELEAHAKQLDIQIRRLASEMSEHARGFKGCVRIWANPSAVIQFLPQALAAFQADYPLVRIQLKEELSGRIVTGLRNGEADIGIFSANADHHGLSTQAFQSDDLVALLPPGHPLAQGEGRLHFAELLSYDFVGLNEGSALLHMFELQAEDLGAVLRVRIQVTSFEAVCRMVEAGLGVSVLPAGGLGRGWADHGLVMRPMADMWAQRSLLIAAAEEARQQAHVERLYAHLTHAGA